MSGYALFPSSDTVSESPQHTILGMSPSNSATGLIVPCHSASLSSLTGDTGSSCEIAGVGVIVVAGVSISMSAATGSVAGFLFSSA